MKTVIPSSRFLPLLLAAAALAGAVLAGAPARADSGDARALMQTLGAEEIATRVTQQMILTLRQTYSFFPAAFWEEVERGIQVRQVVDQTTAACTRHLTPADIQAAIVFFESPAGQRIAQALPAIAQETAQTGGSMGIHAVLEALKKLGGTPAPE